MSSTEKDARNLLLPEKWTSKDGTENVLLTIIKDDQETLVAYKSIYVYGKDNYKLHPLSAVLKNMQ